jgi:hypothetical protein
MRRCVPLVLMPLFLLACASGPRLLDASAEAPPGWVNKTPYQLGDKRYFVGRSNGAQAAADALELARGDATRALVQQLGVTVSEESRSFQEEHNGQFSYDVQLDVQARSEPVTVRNLVVVDRYTEHWRRPASEVDGWVLMSVPEADYQRARRAAAGRVLLHFRCTADPAQLCQEHLMDGVRAALTTAGRPVVPTMVNGPVAVSAQELGVARDAAYVLTVTVHGEFLSQLDGEFYAQARATAQLLDTGDNKVLQSVETGPVKGGHFSREKAVATALKEALKSLVNRLTS